MLNKQTQSNKTILKPFMTWTLWILCPELFAGRFSGISTWRRASYGRWRDIIKDLIFDIIQVIHGRQYVVGEIRFHWTACSALQDSSGREIERHDPRRRRAGHLLLGNFTPQHNIRRRLRLMDINRWSVVSDSAVLVRQALFRIVSDDWAAIVMALVKVFILKEK